MPQSLANLLVHLVFSTKERGAWLKDEWRQDLHAYIGGILKRRGSSLLAANSVDDHIHLLFPLPRTVTMADLVKEIKTGSSVWIHENTSFKHFQWQAGYGAFSLSSSHKDAVMDYIAKQREHHQKVSFQDEFRRLLKKNDIPFDERYVWD